MTDEVRIWVGMPVACQVEHTDERIKCGRPGSYHYTIIDGLVMDGLEKRPKIFLGACAGCWADYVEWQATGAEGEEIRPVPRDD